jgi:hypothetical protein
MPASSAAAIVEAARSADTSGAESRMHPSPIAGTRIGVAS